MRKCIQQRWACCMFALCAVWSAVAWARTIPVYDFPALEKRLHTQSDSVYVVNFWATWCGPCVTELPAFNRVARRYASRKVKVLLVSLDRVSEIDSQLIPFLHERAILPEVVCLNAPDFQAWIDKVDPAWQGSLPATLIFRKTKRYFWEGELSERTLSGHIKSLLP